MTTLEQIATRVYYLLGETSDSSVYDYDNVVVPAINQTTRQILRWEVMNELTDRPIKGGDLSFNRDFVFFEIFTPLVTSLDYNTDSGISINTTTDYTSILNVGDFMILNNEILEILTISPILIEFYRVSSKRKHKAWSKIRLLYNISNLWVDKIGEVMDEENEIMFSAKDSREFAKQPRFYEQHRVEWIDNFFYEVIDIQGVDTGTIKVIYYKVDEGMIDNNDVSILPDDYWLTVLAPIVAGSLLLNTEEANQWAPILKKGYLALEWMYNTYTIKKRTHRQTIGVSSLIFD